jgi:hypothetical protein
VVENAPQRVYAIADHQPQFRRWKLLLNAHLEDVLGGIPVALDSRRDGVRVRFEEPVDARFDRLQVVVGPIELRSRAAQFRPHVLIRRVTPKDERRQPTKLKMGDTVEIAVRTRRQVLRNLANASTGRPRWTDRHGRTHARYFQGTTSGKSAKTTSATSSVHIASVTIAATTPNVAHHTVNHARQCF